MVGLKHDNFYRRLKSNSEVKLYCSKITQELLLADSRYCHLSPHVVGLDVYEAFSLNVPNTKQVLTVSFLQSGHCPGSVMILIEGNEGTVLYTGDLRIEEGGIRSLPILNSPSGPKPLKSVYIDTTFFMPEAFYIPTRQESCNALVTLVREWTSRSLYHMVLIKHKCDLGYEFVLRYLSDQLNMKIHVSWVRYKKFKKIADMTEFVTTDPKETQLHACKWMGSNESNTKRSLLPCGFWPKKCKEVFVRTVVLSTMWFVRVVRHSDWVQRISDSYYRLCYSFHSSYSEIRDVVSYLQPELVFPNVVPSFPIQLTLQEMQDRLNQCLCKPYVGTKGKHMTPKKSHVPPSPHVNLCLTKSPISSQGSTEYEFDDTSLTFLHSKKRLKLDKVKTPEKSSSSTLTKSPDFKLLLGNSSSNFCHAVEDNDADNCTVKSDEISDSQNTISDTTTYGEEYQDEQSWLSDSDAAVLTDFKPLENGKFSNYIAYISSDSDCDVEKNEKGLEGNENELSNNNRVYDSGIYSDSKSRNGCSAANLLEQKQCYIDSRPNNMNVCTTSDNYISCNDVLLKGSSDSTLQVGDCIHQQSLSTQLRTNDGDLVNGGDLINGGDLTIDNLLDFLN